MKNAEYFRNKLLTLRAGLTDRISKVDSDIRHIGMTTDMDDQAIELENEEVLNSLAQTSKRELAMVDKALQHIDLGEYFSCRTCGTDIPLARLELLPFTSQCVRCAEKHEQ